MEKRKPERPPITPRFRMILWVAIGIVPVIMYPILAAILSYTGYEAQTTYSDSLIGAFVALGLIVFFVGRGVARRADPHTNDTAFIVGLALAEAIGIEGFVLWLLIKWNWGFWAMMILALGAAWSLRPRSSAN
ncbi:MAG: hypothetical protein KKA32_03860 [Actinobacteria bacterium]|nr:hypothetical protein [Actinomycetota bacterium]